MPVVFKNKRQLDQARINSALKSRFGSAQAKRLKEMKITLPTLKFMSESEEKAK